MSSRGANESERRGDPVKNLAFSSGLPRSRWSLAMTFGFTMAEILLSLTIIGVVAAITLPSLTGNINERTWNTQRKALYARFSQALALMPSLNGYGTLIEGSGSEGTSSYVAPEDNAAETFITSGLSKVLKINNICDHEHLEDCGVPESIATLNGNVISNFTSSYNTLLAFNSVFSVGTSGEAFYYSQIDTKAAAFETANGESILLYYNPNCALDMQVLSKYNIQPKMCANFVYDLNGNKGPNTMGKDIGFITALYPSDPVVVAPMPLPTSAGSTSQLLAGDLCKTQDSESRVPNREEVASLFYNMTLLGVTFGDIWSSTVITSGENGQGWYLDSVRGIFSPYERTSSRPVRCIKR